MSGRHPHDERLIARWLEPSSADESLDRHVHECLRCAERQRQIAAAFRDAEAAWTHEGATHFTDIRLDAQRRAILDRVSTDNRPAARVLPFRGVHVAAPVASRHSRLAAVAAIAAIVGAVGAGWVIETQRQETLRSRTVQLQRPSVQPPLRAQGQHGQDDLLSDIDLALASPQTPALRALDAFTPRTAESPGRR